MSDKERSLDNLDVTSSKELTAPPYRVIVYGTRMESSGDLASMLQQYFEARGVPNPHVQLVRDEAYIFWHFFGFAQDDQTVDESRLPKGVILFPMMRQYDRMGAGCSISTTHDLDLHGLSIKDKLTQLCAEYNVPFVWAEKLTAEDLDEQLNAITNPTSLVPGESSEL